MNKDVIYIEPENDITDIIDKVKSSKAKVIALVPPKKSAVLSSAVNFKLLARTSKTANKNIVIVTNESALLKLAALAEIPVAKSLQSRPEIPVIISDNSSPKDTVPPDEADDLADKATDAAPKKPSEAEVIKDLDADEPDADPDGDPDDDSDEDSDKKPQKSKSKLKSLVPNFDRWRKWIILGSITVVLIIGFLVWAFVFAPSAKIMVNIRTTGENFSRAISFVTDPQKELLEEGVFALESAEISKKSTAEFSATGETNKGDKATGTISVRHDFPALSSPAIPIPSGTSFSREGRKYVSSKDTSIAPPSNVSACDSDSPTNGLGALSACRITVKINVTAEYPGEKYNTTATSGWTSSISTITPSAASITGGTDKIVRIISQQDFNNARALLSSISESTARADLIEKFPDSTFPIEGSLKVEAKDPISSPKVGEEVPEGTTPKITAETIFTMYGVDREKINQFIISQLAPTLPSGQKVYSTGVSSDPDKNKARVENYTINGDAITAKLTSYSVQVGPAITETEVFEKSSGKKVGEAKTFLKSLIGSYGSIEIETSFFWVSSIPEDPNKVEVVITFEE